MSKKETFQIEEKEYSQLEAIAKKYGFKNVDELATMAIVQFLSNALGGNIRPEDTEEFLDKLNEEQKKNPNLDFWEFVRNFKATPKTIPGKAIGMKAKASKIPLPLTLDFTVIHAITDVKNIVMVGTTNIKKILLRKACAAIG